MRAVVRDRAELQALAHSLARMDRLRELPKRLARDVRCRAVPIRTPTRTDPYTDPR